MRNERLSSRASAGIAKAGPPVVVEAQQAGEERQRQSQ